MIVANFTPDPITWTHGGISGTIKTGDIVEMEEKRANFILNKHSRKGLVRLNFGDDPDVKRKEAMKVWETFWRRQITMFNQDNERRRNTQKEYVEPEQVLIDHSDKLGIKLTGPWTIQQTDNAAVEALRSQNASLSTQIEIMQAQMKDLIEAMKAREVPFALRTAAEKVEISNRGDESQSITVPDESPASEDHTKLILEFSKLSKDRFGEWVMVNLDRLQSDDYPPAVLSMVREKWGRMIKGDFPLPA